MAEIQTGAIQEATESVQNQNTETTGKNNEPQSVESLMAQLAQERALNEKNKLVLDKALREKGELTKQLRAKMTAEEQLAAAQKESEEEKERQYQDMVLKLQKMEYTKKFMGIGIGETESDELAGLVGGIEDADAFFAALGKVIASKTKSAGEAAVQQLLKDRPDIQAGNGSNTKDKAIEMAKMVAEKRTQLSADALSKFMIGGR